MPDPADRTERLRAIPLFAGLPDEALARIVEAGTEARAATGRVLIQQGQAGSGLFVLEEGTVVVERPGLDPIELGPGEFLGDLALLSPEGTHRARVRARTPVRFLAISRKDFERILQEEPRIAVAMLPVLAGRLARLLERSP